MVAKETDVMRLRLRGDGVSCFSPDAFGFDKIYGLELLAGRLLYPGPDGLASRPGLVSDWEWISETQVRVALAKGVTFHDGRQATAADLQYSLQYHRDARHEVPEVAGLKNLVDTEVVSDRELRIRLASYDSAFLGNIRMPVYSLYAKEHMRPSGEHMQAPNRNSGSHLAWDGIPVGAGPYRLVDWEEGQVHHRFERIANFPVPHDGPQTIQLVGADEACDVAVGMSTNPDPDRLRKVVLDIPATIYGFYFQYQHALARDLRFRQALQLGLDRTALAAASEDAAPASTIIPSTWRPQVDSPVEMDREQARRLFAQARADHPDVPLVFGVAAVDDKAQMLVEQLAECGAEFEAVAFSDPRNEHSLFVVGGFIPSVASHATLFGLFAEGSGWVSQLNEPDDIYSALLDKVRRMPNRRAIQNLHNQFHDQAYAVPIYETKVSVFVDPRVVKGVNEPLQDISLMPFLFDL